ncbi:hypothetical protein H310_11701 [Aphanomyces invadans]|uniref:Uncharacterized protein n=1 Tax=Aphanomyces invadans TaxID=157072 RepID=A0A024TKQ5_9STRA|nr:hypothetical protein H310_11701 [Aphanomyces invadans]ETV94735.1 hypothetical protein H310_11701 [Aphanomyces invadans]|eukprot:XP_008876683.1 hypothetical protein H310_11701 [Aphanomyces invadans]
METSQLLQKEQRKKDRSVPLKIAAVIALGLVGSFGLYSLATSSPNQLTATVGTSTAAVQQQQAAKPKNVCLTSRFLTLDQLKTCVHSIPYNATEKALVLEHIRRTWPSYVFTEISKTQHAFGPYSLAAVDVAGALAAIEATDYSNDLELQNALYNVFKKLQDAHTSYHKPSVYAQFYALQPASLISVVRDGKQIIQFSKPDATEVNVYREFFPTDAHDFDVVGWEVVEIDGEPALNALQAFADDHVGILKDGGTRFNLAVSGFGTGRGQFVYRPLSSLDLPTKSFVEYSVYHAATNSTKTVTYNWIGLNGVAKPGRAPPASHNGKLEHYFERLVRHLIYHSLFEPTPVVSYDAMDNSVGVLKIAGFSAIGGDDNGSFTQDFSANVTDALTEFTLTNKSTLILDLTGNGGGDICLGYATIRYLFPQLDLPGPREGVGPHTEAVYHVQASPLVSLLATQGEALLRTDPGSCSSEFCPNQWYSTTTKRQFLDASWATNGVANTVLGDVTQGLYYGCSSYNDFFPPPGANFKGLSPEYVILVSHGYCGSTCSVFSSFIQEHNLAKTVAFGGYKDAPQQFFSFPGGQVYNTGALYDDAVALGVEMNPLVPQPLANISDLYADATFNFALVAISPWKTVWNETLLPLEYTFVPATYSPAFPGNPLNTTSLYRTAVDLVRASA